MPHFFSEKGSRLLLTQHQELLAFKGMLSICLSFLLYSPSLLLAARLLLPDILRDGKKQSPGYSINNFATR